LMPASLMIFTRSQGSLRIMTLFIKSGNII
jgi:hypothetical protein